MVSYVMSVLILAVVIFLSALQVASEILTVVDKNLRDTCTPRCKDTASPGQWRYTKAKDKKGNVQNYYNTFELTGTHKCHFHFYSQKEMAQCMYQNKADLVILGESNSLGLMFSYSTWLDNKDADYVDPMGWFHQGSIGHLYGHYTFYDILSISCAQVNLDRYGYIKWKAVTGGATSTCTSMLSGSASQNPNAASYLSYFRAPTESSVMQALDNLKAHGRAGRNGYFMLNLGNYYHGDTSSYKADMVKILHRIRYEFPNYTTMLIGYTGGDQVKYNTIMKSLLGSTYPKVHYIDTYQMTHATNAPGFAGGHWVHITALAMLQRVLSYACANQSVSECEMQVLGSTNCQYYSYMAPVWDRHWYRSCKTATYSKSSTGSISTGSCTNSYLSQCGGKSFSGNKCCPSGTYCKYINTYWSDCQKS